jgi:hypothetical protein
LFSFGALYSAGYLCIHIWDVQTFDFVYMVFMVYGLYLWFVFMDCIWIVFMAMYMDCVYGYVFELYGYVYGYVFVDCMGICMDIRS